MNFYRVGRTENSPPRQAEYPCAVLSDDNWSDYEYSTTWDLFIYLSPDARVMSGSIKILQKDLHQPDKNITDTILPDHFNSLSNEFCSLGSDLEYYENLRKLDPAVYLDFLVAIRDVAYKPEIAIEFSHLTGWRTSLLRFSESEKAFKEARGLFGTKISRANLSFAFSCFVSGATEAHDVDFDFSPHPNNLYRTFVIIGKNGTGKTQFLSEMAHALSGIRRSEAIFRPERPSFARVIAISYSVFDDFARPKSGRTFSYVYCGIRRHQPAKLVEAVEEAESNAFETEDAERETEAGSLLSPEELKDRMLQARKQIYGLSRQTLWAKILSTLLEEAVATVELDDNSFQFYDNLSSGQRILVAVMTQLVANVADTSLILFDEPELHLHPEVFAALARALNEVLESFDSYAVIATHSSLLLQETWSRQVRIFRRFGTIPVIESLPNETFGETLDTLTRSVFEVEGVDNNFRAHIDHLLATSTIEEVTAYFDGNLPLQVRAYLHAKSRGNRS